MTNSNNYSRNDFNNEDNVRRIKKYMEENIISLSLLERYNVEEIDRIKKELDGEYIDCRDLDEYKSIWEMMLEKKVTFEMLVSLSE